MTMKVRYTVVDGEVIAEKRSGVRKQYVPDSLGSTRALLDNAQTQTDTFSYWPYGEVASRTGTTPTPFQYVGTAGYRQDSASKTYVRARYLDTPKSRWLTEDPLGIGSGDSNIFKYVRNCPTNRIDPTGLLDSQYCLLFCIPFGTAYGACYDACSTAADVQALQAVWDKYMHSKQDCRNPTSNADCFLCPSTGNTYRISCEACCERLHANDQDPETARSPTFKCKQACEYFSEHCKAPPKPIAKTPTPPVGPPLKKPANPPKTNPKQKQKKPWWKWW